MRIITRVAITAGLLLFGAVWGYGIEVDPGYEGFRLLNACFGAFSFWFGYMGLYGALCFYFPDRPDQD